MSMINDYNNRQLVPRLLPFRTANMLSLNINTTKSNIFNMNVFELNNYHKLKTEWKMEKNIILAIQILMYEIVHDSLTVSFELIDYLISRRQQLNHIENEILSLAYQKNENHATQNRQYSSNNDIKNIIKALKEENQTNQLNPFQWCDLGYYYTKIGHKEKAKKSFLIAIGLNNSNRFVVRSVARFFWHMGDVEFAHKILTDSPRIKFDANLISAEIAFSELMGKKSKFIDQGVKLKDDKNISVMEKNELLAQIATLEYSHGKNSKGKKLIEECLINPNENSLAQFAFLEKKRIIEPLSGINFSVIFSYEALARNFFANSEFQKAFENAKSWYDFQPFSNKPLVFASYIASSVLGNYQEAIDILESALNISPGFPILNNLVFSYAKNNQIQDAVNILRKINKYELSDYNKAVLNATTGLVVFKLGDISTAKFCYEEAIKYFRLIRDNASLARALYNYGVLLESIDKNESEPIFIEVSKLSKENSIIELEYLIKKRVVILE